MKCVEHVQPTAKPLCKAWASVRASIRTTAVPARALQPHAHVSPPPSSTCLLWLTTQVMRDVSGTSQSVGLKRLVCVGFWSVDTAILIATFAAASSDASEFNEEFACCDCMRFLSTQRSRFFKNSTRKKTGFEYYYFKSFSARKTYVISTNLHENLRSCKALFEIFFSSVTDP